MRDDVAVVLTGYMSVYVAKIVGVSWIGEGSKAFFLGMCGGAGGYLAKMFVDYLIKKYKNKKKRKNEAV